MRRVYKFYQKLIFCLRQVYEYKSVLKHSLFQIICLEDQKCNVVALARSAIG